MTLILTLWFSLLCAPLPDSAFVEAKTTVVEMLEHYTTAHETQVGIVHHAMEIMASKAWPFNLPELMRRWDGQDSHTVADAIVHAARKHNIDPMLLVAISWKESKFRVKAYGDHLKGKPRSCGPTQIRVTVPNRPTCEQLVESPYFAFDWTAGFLQTFPRRKGGGLDMVGWNGPKAAAWFDEQVAKLHAQLEKERPLLLAALSRHYPTAYISVRD